MTHFVRQGLTNSHHCSSLTSPSVIPLSVSSSVHSLTASLSSPISLRSAHPSLLCRGPAAQNQLVQRASAKLPNTDVTVKQRKNLIKQVYKGPQWGHSIVCLYFVVSSQTTAVACTAAEFGMRKRVMGEWDDGRKTGS